jgi:hypothetical protein
MSNADSVKTPLLSDVLQIVAAMLRGEDSVFAQLRRHRIGLLWCLAASAAGALACVALGQVTGLELGLFTRDPANIYQTNPEVRPMPYIGILSNLGLLLWAACVALDLAGARLVKGTSREARWRGFFLASACVTGFLMLDDAFMFHEWLFPEVFHLREYQLYLIYIAVMGGYLLVHRRLLLGTPYLFLLVAMVLFIGSMGIDKLVPFDNTEAFYEDILKFGALCFWVAYSAAVLLQAAGQQAVEVVARGLEVVAPDGNRRAHSRGGPTA